MAFQQQHRYLAALAVASVVFGERGRDEEDGQDDIIEVEMIPAEELDGTWQRQEVAGGETLLIREEEI
jgi:hypothetical protein